jgi:hypothetical protein
MEDRNVHHEVLQIKYTLRNRGLQCFKLNENQKEIDTYCQKNNFLHFAKCLKMYSFFAFVFKVCKKCYFDHKKNAEFYADFKFIDADLNKCP